MKRFLAVLISLSVIISLYVAPVYATDEYDSTAGSWKFDFGANVADRYVKVTLVNSSDSENANVTLFTATAHKRRNRAETKILKQF